MSNPNPLPPGFRFHPTDEELVLHYLQKRAASLPCPASIIAEVDIYKFDPWDLPAKANMFGDREWYFFSPRDRKYPNGLRPNRSAASGYWKATGTDKPIKASKGSKNIGIKKALVFYKGRPPKGLKSNWIMHEYRLAETDSNINSYKPLKLRTNSMRLDDWVLCRIYKKNNHAQYVPPLIQEGEQAEESGIEDFDSSSFPNSVNHRIFHKLPNANSMLLEDYLSISNTMFDNMPLPDILASQNNFIPHHQSFTQILANNEHDSLLAHQHQLQSNCSTSNSHKRQKLGDEMLENNESFDLLHASKKLNDHENVDANISNNFDVSQCNLVEQASFFNQQIQMKFQFGLQ